MTRSCLEKVGLEANKPGDGSRYTLLRRQSPH